MNQFRLFGDMKLASVFKLKLCVDLKVFDQHLNFGKVATSRLEACNFVTKRTAKVSCKNFLKC